MSESPVPVIPEHRPVALPTAREGETLAKIRERAESEIADAKAGEHYHAEINNGAGLMAEKTRRFAWETVLRLAGASS